MMNENDLKELLEAIKRGDISVDDAYNRLKNLPYADLGFAKVDHHRTLRTGFPEVVYGESKDPEQIAMIMLELAKESKNIMATRCSCETFENVREQVPEAIYYEKARIIALIQSGFKSNNGKIAIVSAGTSDIPVAEEARVTAELMGCQVGRHYDVGVAGIHRLLSRIDEIRNADVVIAVAGMEGALASVVGGLVDVPVIAVPTSVGYGANLGGVSALLSMLNSCANGIGVVNIDNGFGAGYLACLIAQKDKK